MLARIMLTLASLGAMCSTLGAMPITPLSIFELCAEADLIVEARPGVTRPVPHNDVDPSHRVTLTILDELKGQAPAPRIEVGYDRDLTCPSPARYYEGHRVIAFLTWNENIHAFCTVGLSYGTISGSEARLDTYRARIQEAVAIAAEPSSHQRQARVTEWYVRCLEHPATFGEGTTLYHQNYLIDPPAIIRPIPLTLEQQRRVMRAMVQVQYYPKELIELIKNLKDPELEIHLLSYIQEGCGGPDLMEFVAMLTSNRNALRVAQNYDLMQNPNAEFLAAYGGIDYQAAAAKLSLRPRRQRTYAAAPTGSGFKARSLPGVGQRHSLASVPSSVGANAAR